MGFFKGLKSFFFDFAAPIGLSIINPALGAAYSGIKTGIQTGSPLAGLGSAGLSLAMSGAIKGAGQALRGPTEAVTNIAQTAAQAGAENVSSNVITEGLKGLSGEALSAAQNEILKGSAAPILGDVARGAVSGNVFSQALNPGLGSRLSTTLFDTSIKESLAPAPMFGPNIASKAVGILPEFIQQASPLAVGIGSYALKEMASPPPPPAPFAPMQPQRRTTDLSKYGYKGPLDRGEYTYADPEDIAYGRTTPSSYGYLGAKEGGVIKAQGGGVMMQRGLLDPAVEATKGTFRPTGSMVPPTAGPSIARLAQTQPMMSINPQKTRALAQPVAPTVPTNMPMSSPTPMMPPQGPMLPQGGGGLASQPAQPQIENNAQKLIDQLPQKDISVNIDQIRQFIGLAEGGEVKDDFNKMGIYQKPEDYNVEEMAKGGEVNSDKTLQENAFVIPADVVGHIGDGSSDAGAQRLQSYLGMNPQQYQAGGIMAGELQGPGGGMDDLIQTSIEGKRAAAVSPQEFVVPRDIVAELGQGSYDKGSNKLYALMRNVRKTKTGTTKQPAELTQGLGQLMRTAIG